LVSQWRAVAPFLTAASRRDREPEALLADPPVDELMTIQGVYRKWVGTLPPSLEASATVDALRAICELDLSKLESV